MRRPARWTAAALGLLRALYPTASWAKLEAVFPGRTRSSLANQAYLMGVKRPRHANARLSRLQLVRDLKAERERQGLSRAELGRRMGYSKLAAWEGGFQDPKLRTVLDWADALGLEIRLISKTWARVLPMKRAA